VRCVMGTTSSRLAGSPPPIARSMLNCPEAR